MVYLPKQLRRQVVNRGHGYHLDVKTLSVQPLGVVFGDEDFLEPKLVSFGDACLNAGDGTDFTQ